MHNVYGTSAETRIHPRHFSSRYSPSHNRDALILLRLNVSRLRIRAEFKFNFLAKPFNIGDNFSQGLPDYCVSRLALFFFHSNRFSHTRSVALTSATRLQLETFSISENMRTYAPYIVSLPRFLQVTSPRRPRLCCPFERNVKSASHHCTRGSKFLLEQYLAVAAQFAPLGNIIKLKIYKLRDSQR